MSPNAQRYVDLLRELDEIRRVHGDDSKEEDALLDALDVVWYTLSRDEIAEAEAAL